MVPPQVPNSSQLDISLPLSRWIRLGNQEYPSREQCESDLEEERDRVRHLGQQLAMRTMAASECVSANDPRLQAK